MNRQKMLLFILVIVLIAAIVYAFFRMPQQKSVERLKYASGAPASRAVGEAVKGDDKKVHLELLDRQVSAFSGFKRNIFSLTPLKSKVATLPPPPPPPPPPVPLPPPPPPPPPPPSEEALTKAEMAKFTFLGFLRKDNKKIMFLSKDNEIFVVGKGDKIANRFEITSITDDFMTIQSIPDGAQTVIPLMENMPLLSKRR